MRTLFLSNKTITTKLILEQYIRYKYDCRYGYRAK